MQIKDALGQSFQPQKFERIVCLVPSLTETLFAFGLRDHVVGVTRYCIYPEEAKQKTIVGGTKTVSHERIKDLKPDIIIANMEENREKDVKKLMTIAPTFVTFPKSFKDNLKMMGDLVTLFQIENENINDLIEKGWSLLNTIENKEYPLATTFCPIWKNPWMTINKDTYIHDIIRLAGGKNVFAAKPDRYPVITLEELGETDVQVVILPDEPYQFTSSDRDELKQFQSFRDSVFILMEGSYLSWYGVRSVKGLEFLREKYHEIFNSI